MKRIFWYRKVYSIYHCENCFGLLPKAIFLTIILLLFLIQPSFAQTIDKIVAIVNDEVITQTDLDRVLATIETEYRTIYPDSQEFAQKLKLAKENIVNQMLEEKLVLCEAKKLNIKSNESRIDAQIEQIKENFAGEEEFERALEVQGLTRKDLRDRFRDQEIMKKAVDYFVRSKINIDPIEIKDFFKSQKAEFAQPERAHLKSILIRVDSPDDEYKALRSAKRVLVRLRKGDNFEELAKSYSQGASAGEGGDSGFFVEKGELIKEIDEAVFSLNSGEFTDVIKTNQGYRIFKVVEKKPAKPLTFSEAQDVIRQMLYRKKFTEAFKEWIEKLKENAYIMIKKDSPDEQR